MVAFTRIRCTGQDIILTRMGRGMRASLKMMRGMGGVSIPGQMGNGMKANSKQINNTVKE
jgi:hypothetical protein